jgi:hypothetical protein
MQAHIVHWVILPCNIPCNKLLSIFFQASRGPKQKSGHFWWSSEVAGAHSSIRPHGSRAHRITYSASLNGDNLAILGIYSICMSLDS